MCYVNSALIGLRNQVSSIRQAVSLIGFSPLYRWLSMMLVYCGGEAKAAAAAMALMRGRMMETLGKGRAFNERDSDAAQRFFLTGAFSYLDALLDMPFESILERLHLHPDIEKAILNREGELGEYLRLIEAFDDEGEELLPLSKQLKVSADALNAAQFESMAWMETLIV
jgi:EAL and modified HD-GYP domain-containing signal transduction protein